MIGGDGDSHLYLDGDDGESVTIEAAALGDLVDLCRHRKIEPVDIAVWLAGIWVERQGAEIDGWEGIAQAMDIPRREAHDSYHRLVAAGMVTPDVRD